MDNIQLNKDIIFNSTLLRQLAVFSFKAYRCYTAVILLGIATVNTLGVGASHSLACPLNQSLIAPTPS